MNSDSSLSDAVAAYLAALDDGEIGRALSQFSDDAMYVVPSVKNGRIEGTGSKWLQGRSQIESHMVARGRQPFVHNIRQVLEGKFACCVLGTVEMDEETSHLFVGYAATHGDGRISRYVVTSLTGEAGLVNGVFGERS